MTVDEVMRWVTEAIAQAESAVFAGMGSDSEELQERQRAEHKLDIARRAIEAYAAEKVRERTEECAVAAWKHYMDTCKRDGIGPAFMEKWNAATAIRARFLVDDRCPDCGRKKAASAEDCAGGACPKWYMTRDAEAQEACARFLAGEKESDHD